MVKSKLSKKYIFNEAIDKDSRLLKFSIPNVKVGTVIEYKYSKTSGIISYWNMQSEIPVMNSTLEVFIPEFFIYNVATKGYEHIHVEQSYKYIDNWNNKYYKFSAQDLPALKNEPNVWYLNDFRTGVSFELQATKSRSGYFTPYTSTWSDLEKTLLEKTVFGENLKIKNPFKDETKDIENNYTDEEERIAKIYEMVTNNIRWNDIYSFWGYKVKDAIKQGVGNNAHINFVLLSALKDAKITTFPVLISRRTRGRLPYTHPSINKLNTFLVCAQTSNGKSFFMDGSAIYGGLNLLPHGLLVDRGYILDDFISNKWVNLTEISKNRKIVSQIIKFNENQQLTCERNTRYQDQFAYQIKQTYKSSEDSLKYIEKIQNDKNITVTDLIISGNNKMSNKVDEKMSIIFNEEHSDEYLYINPFLFEPVSNTFKQSERKLPIEFDYPYILTIRTTILVPQDYNIEEIPEEISIEMDNDSGICLYSIIQDENIVQLSFHFELNQIIFPPTDYAMIQEFFGLVAAKCEEFVVLKKINPPID